MKIDEIFLIDTNILIYSLDKDSQFHDFSKKIIDDNTNTICIASKTISEFICVLSKLGRYDIIMKEFERITTDFTILYANEKSLKFYETLVFKYKPGGTRIYDIEIVSVMLANNIRKIATFNRSDFKTISEIELIDTE